MGTLREWLNRLRYLGRRSRFDDDLDVEVRFHLESRTAELIASGLSPRDAAARARAEFGSVRARRRGLSRGVASSLDCRSGRRSALWVRTFRRSPGFVATAVVSLALGSGPTRRFSMRCTSLLWKPLPVSKPEELV